MIITSKAIMKKAIMPPRAAIFFTRARSFLVSVRFHGHPISPLSTASCKTSLDKTMLGYFVGAVREPPEIMALLEAPLPHYNAISRSATSCSNYELLR